MLGGEEKYVQLAVFNFLQVCAASNPRNSESDKYSEIPTANEAE
jgi:hypothetical protein